MRRQSADRTAAQDYDVTLGPAPGVETGALTRRFVDLTPSKSPRGARRCPGPRTPRKSGNGSFGIGDNGVRKRPHLSAVTIVFRDY